MNFLKAITGNGVLVAILGHGLIGISLVWDKVLLGRREATNLLAYVFWLGAISVFGLALLPFGFQTPKPSVAALAFSAGVLDLVAAYFYYAALKAGEASEELAAMGGFTPVATALISVPLLKQPIGGQLTGFILMTLGGFIMFFADKSPKKKMLPRILIASTAFGLVDVLQKIAFNNSNFVTGYVCFTMGTFAGSLALLIPPSWRQQILERSEQAPPKRKLSYMVNRFLAGVGSFLVVFAISRASPAIVEAISGVRYVVIFIGALAISFLKPEWFKEDFSGRVLAAKLTATALIVAGLAVVGLHSGESTARARLVTAFAPCSLPLSSSRSTSRARRRRGYGPPLHPNTRRAQRQQTWSRRLDLPREEHRFFRPNARLIRNPRCSLQAFDLPPGLRRPSGGLLRQQSCPSERRQ